MKSKLIIGGIVAATVLVVMALVVRFRLGDIALTPLDGAGLPIISTTDDGRLRVLSERMPEFTGIEAWLNSEALTAESLKGKVVLVDFWTYSCINCIRTSPFVTAWHEKYQDDGFTVVGVHTPEFAFEKEEKNVRAAIARLGITYPVALDNAFGTWNAYSNRYWPAHYLFDAQGRLRFVHFGEGKYDETESAIRSLLAEAGEASTDPMTDLPTVVDFSKVDSPETYIGYERQESFESPERVTREAAREYTIPERPSRNKFSLGGEWTVGPESATLGSQTGAIVYRFDASNANLVMGAPATVRAEVTLDGAPVPPELRGADVKEEEGKTVIYIDEERLYSIVDGKGSYGEHLLRIDFLGGGVECYAYTFG